MMEIWQAFKQTPLPAGFALGNGRIEAIEVQVASKLPGRVAEVLVREGDMVTAGQRRMVRRRDGNYQQPDHALHHTN